MSRLFSVICLLFALFFPGSVLAQEEEDAPAGVSEEAAEALGEDRGKSEDEQLEEILSSQQNEYDLINQGNMKVDYSVNYSFNSSPRANVVGDTTAGFIIDNLTRDSQHTLNQSISLRYGLLNYLSTGLNIPIVAKVNTARDQSVSAFGDVSLSSRYQPYVVRPGEAKVTFSSSLNLPTGRSPYEIDQNQELSTGSGLYGVNAGMNFSKTFDPVVAFGNLGINYSLPKDDIDQVRRNSVLLEIEPGPSVSWGMGMAWSLSYDVSITYSFNYSLSLPTETTSRLETGEVVTRETNTTTSAIFNISTGWRVSPQYQMTLGLGLGLTENSPDFSLNVGFPLVLETPGIL